MTKLTYTQRFATRFEKKIMSQQPELLKLYQRICGHDYWYDFCDALPGWRAGLESERDIIRQLDENKEHKYYPILQCLWSNKGDKESIDSGNVFEEWLEKYRDESMDMYRFLETLDRLQMDDEKIARAVRAMRQVSKFLIEESEVESKVVDYFPKLVYTKHLGPKSIGKCYVDKVQLPRKLQRFTEVMVTRAEMYDFDCLGLLTPHVGTFDTVRFDPESENEEHLAYIKGYHFKSVYILKGKLLAKIRRIELRDLKDLTEVLRGKGSVQSLYTPKDLERV
ncbi:hypothetical protein [Photobacterium phage PDCC-1]|uniref:Uncharacterized protein n=1 Tax=Photobacterium phage PDCC-1 TaxID=2664246 RepID=A0A6B9J459_9CAUD|nr:hypothetical protein HWC77_gp059 [Photobacterium phage PDCC-1]QGZ14422.1 hypothetical protein [Photobacterium phage PDCC-1]